MKKIIRKSVYIGTILSLFTAVISCEEDFRDIGSNVISNTKFDTNSVLLDVNAENSPLERVQSDNISQVLSQYLLGVYNPSEYEKLEASIVSQIEITTGLKVIDKTYGTDTTVVSKIDTVFLKIPYQASLDSNSDVQLDSIIGDQSKAFNLNIFRSNTFINTYNPTDPTKINKFYSNDVFEKTGSELNTQVNYPFIPNKNDTMLVVKRRLFDDTVATTDTLKLSNSATSTVAIPFARIPLNKTVIKELFLDKFESSEFASQTAFNNYFRGVILEASGNEGSLVSFNFNSTVADLVPSIEVYYTNTVLKSGTTIIDTISKKNSFPLKGFRVNTYKTENKVYPANNEIKIQGTAGSEGDITFFDQAKIDELRSKNWLINDASLIFYINQSADTTNVPFRLYLYKVFENNSVESYSQIKDAASEAGFGGVNGFLERDSNGKKEKYTFRITDYVSDILNGTTNYSTKLRIKAFNTTDLPNTTTAINDTIFRNFSWSPKAVTLLNNSAINGDKKAVLKISYSEKKN
ncbi:MAG: DUF4270 domain-containing protein [Polaribacter sp.]|uniref:DUF4270 domain-containing protein n=1 Tax=Polaribacter sp. TaxID=1920175 RepID=UPI003BB21432